MVSPVFFSDMVPDSVAFWEYAFAKARPQHTHSNINFFKKVILDLLQQRNLPQ
jgi:hypothetical protein